MPLPVLNYAPETGLVLGAAGAFYLRPEDPTLRATDWVALLAYSTKHLALGAVDLDGYAFRDALYVGANLKVARFPSEFYGIGNDTELADREPYVFDGLEFTLSPMGRVVGDLYAGGIVTGEFNDLRQAEAGGLLETRAVRGASGGRTLGLGVASKYDTRDSTLNATRGELLSFDLALFRPTWGSQFTYESARLDARKFVTVWPGHVLAAELYLGVQHGEPPYFALHELGGTYKLRGHYEGRYRDQQLWLTQIEYRFPLFWRVGGVGFAGVGNVARRLSDLFADLPKPAGGVGLRLLLDRGTRINLAFDYGVSSDQDGFYVNLGEVF